MSSLTEEWQMQIESGVEYKVSIEDFANKMKTYEPGQVITSRTFYVGESSFELKIYPNGNRYENRRNISVYLYNKSEWRVRADGKFSVKNYCKNLEEQHLYDRSGGHSGWGFKDFLPHFECYTKDLLDGDSTFVLKAEIKLSEEEVTLNRKLYAHSLVVERGENKECLKDMKKLTGDCVELVRNNNNKCSEEMKKLTRDFTEVVRNNNKECSEEIRKLKTEIYNMKTLVQNNNTEMDNLKRSVETLKMSNQTEGHIPTPECPVCLETVIRPMRLMQCGMGHIICDSCYRKSREEARRREEGDRDMARCHTCRGQYIGRPVVLERMLGLLD